MKIYTRTGDKGETSLFGGTRVRKDAPRIEAYGTVDELNSIIGVARAFNNKSKIDDILAMVQNQLFVLGADLATPKSVESSAVQRISPEDTSVLEATIDELSDKLKPLKYFILPGGTKSSSMLHYARTVCRRAERRVAPLAAESDASDETLVYLNRLSDLLFVLARYAAKVEKKSETPWNPRHESRRKA